MVWLEEVQNGQETDSSMESNRMLKIVPILLICTVQMVFAQPNTENKNNGLFNITSFRVGWLTSGEFSRLGAPANQLDVSEARMNSLQTITGIYLNPNYSVGVGFGLDGYSNPTHNTMPVFLDLRAYLYDEKNTAFFLLNIGGTIGIEDLFRRGTMGEIGFGYKYYTPRNLKLIGSINFHAKGLSLTGERYTSAERAANLRGLLISFGVLF